METKIKLNISSSYTLDELKAAICNSLVVEYLIDDLQKTLRDKGKEINIDNILNTFSDIIDNNENVSFASVAEWNLSKVMTFNSLLALVAIFDNTLAEQGQINAGEIIAKIQEEVTNFTLNLSLIEFNEKYIDLKTLKIKHDYLEDTLRQLRLVDENQVLSALVENDLEVTPLEIEKYRNTFIEEKLRRLAELINTTNKTLDLDFEKFFKQITKMHTKFRDIAYEHLTDGEKYDKSRKLIKQVNPHRQLLDKLEDGLTEANELKRQLHVHEERLKKSLVEEIAGYDRRIAEDPENTEMFEREKESVKYVTENYFAKIDALNHKLLLVQNRISDLYKIYDKVENVLKTALPSEDEMKKYTTLSFKFQDLSVRLELAKSQVNKGDKEFKAAFDSAVAGLSVIIQTFVQAKDLFIRQSLMTAIFNVVNSIYDIVDEKNKSIELSQIKFVTNKLAEYSILSASFNKDLLTLRHVGNNGIRDLAIMMGKPFNYDGMLEILSAIDLAINQLNHLYDLLDKNLQEQIQLLTDILAI